MNEQIKNKVEELQQLLAAETREQEKTENPTKRLAAFILVTSVTETEEPCTDAPVASPASDAKADDRVEPRTHTKVALETCASVVGREDDLNRMLQAACEKELQIAQLLRHATNPLARLFDMFADLRH